MSVDRRHERTAAASVGLLVAVLLAYPFVDHALRAQTVYAVTDGMIYVLLALGLNIVVGYAGLLDLGYAAFFAIGAYAMGLLNSRCSGRPSTATGGASGSSSGSRPSSSASWDS